MDASEGFHRAKKRNESTSNTRLSSWLAVTAALRIMTSTVYLIIRIRYTFEAQRGLLIYDKLVAWVFLLIEIGFAGKNAIVSSEPKVTLIVTRLHGDFVSWYSGGRTKVRSHPHFDSQTVPTVDVFITFCGESLGLLLDTVRASCVLEYPRDKFRVFVLDDSCSSGTEKAIQELAAVYPNLQYTSRGAVVDTHSKAANLNHGLHFTESAGIDGTASELIAGLDVDMIPDPAWLKVLVPHITDDHRVGMVFIPQSFYNVPIGDPLSQMPVIHHLQKIQNVQREISGNSVAGGSGYVARRSAITQIGGMPEDAIAEDFVASVKLRRAGWRLRYIDEKLQWGLMPDTFAGHLKQRRRWKAGSLGLLSMFRQVINSSPHMEPTLRVRLLGLETSTALSVGLTSLCFLMMPLILASNRPLLLIRRLEDLKVLLYLAIIDMVAQVFHGAIMSWQTQFTIHVFHGYCEMWLNIYLLPTLLRHWVPTWCLARLRNQPKFTPGGSAASRSPEHDVPYRYSVLFRLKLILWDHGAWAHLIILVSTLAGCWTTVRNIQDMSGFLVRGGWPSAVLMWTSVIINAWVPTRYAIFTPKKSQREKLLLRDPGSNVAYPSQAAKEYNDHRVAEWQLVWVAGYTAFVALQLLQND